MRHNDLLSRLGVGCLISLLCACGEGAAPHGIAAQRITPGALEAAPRRWPSPLLPALTGAAPAPVSAGVKVRNPRHMRLLLVTATDQEPAYLALRAFFDQIGVPFDTLVATTTELTPERLSDGATGRYQAIALATSNLAYFDGSTWRSAFSDAEWQTLWTYEAEFGVRQMTYYSVPGSYPDDLGLELVGTRAEPMDAWFSAEGRAAFPYLRTQAAGADVPLAIRDAYTYLARARDASVLPLLSFEGHPLLSIKRYPDGRENLTCTVAHNPDLRHSLLLNYGMVNWLTRGVFLGERHLYLSAHVDDFLLANSLWDPALDQTGAGSYRMEPADLSLARMWQRSLPERRPSAAGFRLEIGFSGDGATRFGPRDPLAMRAAALEEHFAWLNHGYTRQDLAAAGYGACRDEILRNNAFAQDVIGATVYHTAVLALAGATGIDNPTCVRATYNNGVRYVGADASVLMPPSPNVGVPHPLDPRITLLPRRPTNLFVNVSTVEEWVDEYNFLYRGFWGRDLSLGEILDADSDLSLNHLLRYTWVPLVFHQTNLRTLRSEGRRWQLLTEYLDTLIAKYERLYTLPLVNLPWYQVALYTRRWMQYRQSGAEGLLDPGAGTVTIQVRQEARIPLTGLPFDGAEDYGGQHIGYVRVRPGAPLVLPLP